MLLLIMQYIGYIIYNWYFIKPSADVYMNGTWLYYDFIWSKEENKFVEIFVASQ